MVFFSKKNKVQSCLNQKEINTLNCYRRAKLTFFFFFLTWKDCKGTMKFLKEPCPNPSSRIAQRRPLFAAPHFNLPHPGHVVGFFVFLFHKSYCSDVGLAHLPTNFKIKRHCTSFAYRAPWGCFLPLFVFPFPPPPASRFCFVFVLFGVGGGKLGFLSPLNTLGHGNAVL